VHSDNRVRAVGLKCRPGAAGCRRYYWFAPKAAAKAGYEPTMVRVAGDDTSEMGRLLIESEARRLQADSLRWCAERSTRPVSDGTIAGLIRRYQTDLESPYQEIKWNTRWTYDDVLRRIYMALGKRRLESLKLADFRRWYDEVKLPAKVGGPERVRKAHGLISMFRRLIAYGVAAEIPQCDRLDRILSKTRFKQPAPSRDKLTFEQVEAFVTKAVEMSRLSLAIGTTIQFERRFGNVTSSANGNRLNRASPAPASRSATAAGRTA